jgi:hypothetical protein
MDNIKRNKRPPPNRDRRRKSFEENIRLNKLITTANSEAEIFNVIKRKGNLFNIVNCSTSFSSFGKRAPINVNHEMFNKLCSLTRIIFMSEKDNKTILPRHISGVLWGIAKVTSTDRTIANNNIKEASGLIQTILDYTLQYKYSRFSGQEISMCIYSLGKLSPQFSNHPAIGLLFVAVENKINQFNTQGLANIIYSLSAILMSTSNSYATSTDSKNQINSKNLEAGISRDTYLLLLDRVILKLKDFNPQEFSNTLSGIAKIGFSIIFSGNRNVKSSSSAELLITLYNKVHNKIDDEVQKVLNECSAQNTVNILWALVKIESDDIINKKIPFQKLPKAFDIEKLGFIKKILKNQAELKTLEISMIFWSLSRNSVFRHAYVSNNKAYEIFFSKLFEKIIMLEDQLNSQQISTISMSLARLNFSNSNEVPANTVKFLSSSSQHNDNKWSNNILKTLSKSALSVMSEFTFQDLENCLISLEKMDTKQIGKKELGFKKLLKSSVARASLLLENYDQKIYGYSRIEPQNVCNFMLALAKFKWKRDLGKLVTCSEAYIIERKKILTPRDIANVAWAFSKLGIGRKAVSCLSDEAVIRMEEFNAQELSKLLFAIDKCNIKNEKLQAMYSKPVKLIFEFNNLDGAIVINHLPGGGRDQTNQRELTGATGATGCSLWDPSIALSHFLADHFIRGSSKKLSDLFPNCKFDFNSWFKSLDKVVELGSGIGLCSIVAGKAELGHVISTDGDPNVCKLLQSNITLNNMDDNMVSTCTMGWGIKGKELKKTLGISSFKEIKLVMASGCVYGSDPQNWKSLYKTIRALSSKRSRNTLIILSHGNGAAPGVFEGEGNFYNEMMKEKFHVYVVPPNLLNTKYRESCSIHMLWRQN